MARRNLKEASIVFAAALLATLSGCSEKIDSFDEYVQLARLRERQENYPAAVEAYSRALKIIPDDSTTLYDRGVAYLDSGQTSEAIADYLKAVELDPEFAIAWNNLGAAQLVAGDSLAAVTSCTRSIEIDPTDALPWRNRGLAKQQAGLMTQSLDDLTQADRLEPGDPFTLRSRAVSFLNTGQPQRAVTDLTASIEIDDSEPTTWLDRATAWYRCGELESARSDFKEARARGVKVEAASIEELSAQRHTRLPEPVQQSLTDAGYKLEPTGWQKSGKPVQVVAKMLTDGEVLFDRAELAALSAADGEKVLVVFDWNADGIRVVRTFENWVPDATKMQASKLALPVE